MNNVNPFEQSMNQLILKQIQENWKWYLALGIALVVIGSLAILFALTSTIISVVFLGGLLITFGIIEGIKSFKINEWQGFFLHMFLGILYLVGGIFMVWHPLANAISLTLLLAIFFVISGIMRIYFALTHAMPHKIWALLNGVITLILGVLIWYQLPTAGLWVIGTFLGIDMIFTGWTWIMLSLSAKKMINRQ